MYGRVMRSRMLISAHRTTGQRAISSITPRHDRRTPAGWNHRRVKHHINAPVSGTGRKYNR